MQFDRSWKRALVSHATKEFLSPVFSRLHFMIGMSENTVRLGKYELLKYSFGSFLSSTDVATDILTAIIYYQQKHFVWFGFCLLFALLPSFLLTLAFILQSCGQETICTLLRRFLFFANPCGSGILKFKLLLVCLRNYDEVCSFEGFLVNDERLRQDYRAEKVYHYIEGLLENMPQIILQIYATIIQDEKISAVQMFSISVTFVNLVWVLTVFEYGSVINTATITPFIAIVLYNACLIAARGLSIVVFLVAFKWITSAILAFHGFVCISIYLYRNHEYFTEKKVWWIASLLMPCYIFVYLGFKVKELNSKLFDIKLGRSMISSCFFYVCFIAENILMVSLFLAWTKTSNRRWSQWISNAISILVVVLSLVGTLIHLFFTHVYFRKPHQVSPAYAAQESQNTEAQQDRDDTVQSQSDLRTRGFVKTFSLLEPK